MIEQEFIDFPDIFPLLKMKDRRECVDIPDMILFLKIKSVVNILRLIGKLLIMSSILGFYLSLTQNGLL